MNLSLEKGFFLLISRSRLSVLLSRKKLLTATSLILGNYRPISNLSFLSKTLKRIVASQIDEYLHDNGLYANSRQWIQPVFISVRVNPVNPLSWPGRLGSRITSAPSCSNNSPKSGEGLFDIKLVSCSEVRKVLTVMPSNKAPGYDRIPLFVIKDCLPYILPTLTRLINSSFACSEFPRAWKKSVIVPHLKDGDHEVPNNNRPISLLPVLSKVAEKIALIQFNDFLTKQDKLTQHQSGNRKNHSTETLSLLVTDHIFRAIDRQQLTAMVLIDLSKAFDSICHSTLLLKLNSLGTSSQALKWFESYLTDRKQSTRLGTSLSDELTITHCVFQGSILGPMLFNLYINDLPSAVNSSSTDSYVDNTKIYRSFLAKNMNSCLVKMTEDLSLIAGWCCSHQLLINPSKTKLIFFGTRQLLSKVSDIRAFPRPRTHSGILS